MSGEKPNHEADASKSELSQPSLEQASDADPSIDNESYEFARSLVQQAGDHIMSGLGRTYETTWKDDNTPVTDIDTYVNRVVKEAIGAKYPGDKLYGEEESSEGVSESGYTWILDPIDGTQALGKLDTFTVCLARVDPDGQPTFSMILNPSRGELFSAKLGERTTLNDEPVKVSTRETIKSSYIHFGSRICFEDLATNGVAYDRLEQQGAKIINTRSLAFGCIEVAAGQMDGAYIGVETPFEAASVKLIVEGAGGKVTDLYGNVPGRLDGEIRGLIVSNGLIHDELVAAVKKD